MGTGRRKRSRRGASRNRVGSDRLTVEVKRWSVRGMRDLRTVKMLRIWIGEVGVLEGIECEDNADMHG